ncbi:hypothetical protein D3C74_468510 [compost metagenome]
MDAYRWGSVQEIQVFLYGRYAPLNPSEYRAQPVKITYELKEENEDVNSQSTTEGH